MVHDGEHRIGPCSNGFGMIVLLGAVAALGMATGCGGGGTGDGADGMADSGRQQTSSTGPMSGGGRIRCGLKLVTTGGQAGMPLFVGADPLNAAATELGFEEHLLIVAKTSLDLVLCPFADKCIA